MAALAATLTLGACGGGDSAAKKSTATGPIIGPTAPSVTGQTLPTGGDDAVGNAKPLPWEAPTKNVKTLIEAAGLQGLPAERFEYHVHAHLDVFLDGVAQVVPANLGIDLDASVISPLHTHDESGIIHVENSEPAQFVLRQLFTEWDVRLTDACVGAYCKPAKPVAFYVDGAVFTGDPRTIEFVRHREIAVVIGTPPKSIPASFNWPANT
jgi:hypothetical protein